MDGYGAVNKPADTHAGNVSILAGLAFARDFKGGRIELAPSSIAANDYDSLYYTGKLLKLNHEILVVELNSRWPMWNFPN